MRKALRIISKVLAMTIGVIFLIMSLFEFMIIYRGDTSLFENAGTASWLYLLRGIASLSCFLLALSLFLFPKSNKVLPNLFATTGIALIVIVSFHLMESYVYIPLVIIGILPWALTSYEFYLSKKENDPHESEEKPD